MEENIDIEKRKEVFSIYHYAKTQNIKLSETNGFTENKEYEILEEKYYSVKNKKYQFTAINDYCEYLVIDDNGRKRYISHIYFLPNYWTNNSVEKLTEILKTNNLNFPIDQSLNKIIDELEDKVIECHNLIAKLRNQTKNAN